MITLASDDILLKYTSGVLDPALHLLVERHINLHPATRPRLAAFEQLGGMMLAAETPADMTAGSLERALARLALPVAPSDPDHQTHIAPQWPALDQLDWRWAGLGRHIANVEIPGSAMKAYALKIAPGKAMLQHSHADHEWTLIVEGSYRDESGEYHTGAFIEEDADTVHTPIATGDTDCICLAVLSGPLTAPGMMGKVAHWIMR